MSWTFNPFAGKLDYFTKLTSPLQFKGNIAVNTDFPLIANVQTGWFYTVSASVTDNAGATYTNTGQSFISGDEIAWDGSLWVLLGNNSQDLHLDQTTPQTFTGGTVTGSGLLKVTSGQLGLDTNSYLTTETDPLSIHQSILTTAGDIIYRGATEAERLGIGTGTQVLHGGVGVPSYSAVVEADISLSNNTTNNATVSRHGFLPTLSGLSNTFLRGDGIFAAPTASTVPNAYVIENFTGTSHNVVHNFGTYPVVQVQDSTGAILIPISIVHNSVDDFTVTLSVSAEYNIIATVGAPQLNSFKSVSDDYTMEAGDYIIKETVSGKTITLLTAVGRAGKIVVIKNTSTGIISVVGYGTETIEGVTNVTIPSTNAYTLFSDGANWWAI